MESQSKFFADKKMVKEQEFERVEMEVRQKTEELRKRKEIIHN